MEEEEEEQPPPQQQQQQQQQQPQQLQPSLGQILGQNLANLFLPDNVHFSFNNDGNGFQISSRSVDFNGQQQQQRQMHPLGEIFPMFQQIMQQFRAPRGRQGINFGDFVPEEHMSQLLHQLMMNNPNQHGTPPTEQSVIDSLPVSKWGEHNKEEEKACAVCQDEFVSDDTFIRLPCKHIYHKDCIIPWLKMHSTCPVCRAKLS